MYTIKSIGHSTLTAEKLVRTLKENAIELVVDVRTYGFSKRNPQFNRNVFYKDLREVGIDYTYYGNQLGGMGENYNYREAIKEVADMVKAGKKIAVLCSESDYKQCHRHTELEPDFLKEGVDMEHIGGRPNNLRLGLFL